MCGGGKDDKPVTPATPPMPPLPQIALDMVRAADLGPTGFTKDMRGNLGMDIQMGGAKPTSGMTKAPMTAVTGYVPVAAPADPLVPIIPYVAPPPPPKPPIVPPTVVTPITINPNDVLKKAVVDRDSRRSRSDM